MKRIIDILYKLDNNEFAHDIESQIPCCGNEYEDVARILGQMDFALCYGLIAPEDYEQLVQSIIEKALLYVISKKIRLCDNKYEEFAYIVINDYEAQMLIPRRFCYLVDGKWNTILGGRVVSCFVGCVPFACTL